MKGTTNGTTSDLDGNFRLSVPENGGTLVFRFVGFESQEVEIGSKSVINVTLSEDVTELSEVVITGYGQQLKTDLTGNVAQVSGKDIENLPVPNFEEAIQERASGVFIESSNGKIGQGIKVRVRGTSSIAADSQPLFVVDGIPITTSNVGNPAEAAVNPLSDINPNDIASIEVLKDASAAAIYGSRAANGVVIITTKSGSAGKTKFNFNYQTGISNPTNKREWLNAEEYVDYLLEGAANSDESDGLSTEDPDSWTQFVLGRLDRYSGDSDWTTNETDTNWEDQAYNDDARNTRVDLSVSGGNEKTKFFLSGSYVDQEGIMIGNSMERISSRLNISHDATDKLSIGMNTNFVRTSIDRVSDDSQFSTPLQLIALAPITPIYDSEGNLNDRPVTTYYNGLIDFEGVTRSDVTYRNLSNMFLSYDIIDGLSIRGELGVDLLTQNQERYWADYTDGGEGTNGYGISRWIRVLNYNAKAYANYSKTLDQHAIDFTGGFDFQRSTTSMTRVEGQEFPVNDLKTLASAADIAVGTSTLTEFTFLSYFGRLNYKLMNKYLLTVSARLDGSSRFGSNNKYGFFPAAALGWIITEEGVLANSSTLSFLKFRVSYGLTGNAGIGNFDHLGLYGAEGYAGNAGLQPTQVPNPNLTWEENRQFDVGVDFGFFSDRINGELDFYIKESSNLLLDVNVPGSSGFRTQIQNIGALENRGVEFVINGTILDGPVSWTSSFNIAFNKNEVTDLGEVDIIDNGSSRTMNVVREGSPIGVFYGAEYAGVDPETGDAQWYVNSGDSPRDKTSNFGDAAFVPLGSPNPDYVGGFNNQVKWNGFDFNIFFQFVEGNMVHNVGGVFQEAGDWFDNPAKSLVNRWQESGDVTDVPKIYFAYGNGGQGRSSRFLYDASYIRMKSITLGYSLPRQIISRAKISSARIYLSGINLLTITDYPGWDPEVSADYLTINADGSNNNIFQGNDFYSAPQAKTFTLGVQIGF